MDNSMVNWNKSHAKYLYDYSIFEKCDTPDKAYWIGFIMADGCVIDDKKKQYQLIVGLAKKDYSHLEKLRKFLGTNKPIEKMKDDGCQLRINSKKIVRDLYKYGIIPNKTGREIVKGIPQKYLRDFIRGYFDGDGWIFHATLKRKTPIKELRVGIVCSCKKFLDYIQNVLVLACCLRKTKIHRTKHQSSGFCGTRPLYYFLYQGNGVANRVCDYMYRGATISLDRKRKRWTG